jgi:hypothetical protein
MRFSRMTDLLYLMTYCKKNLITSESRYNIGKGSKDMILRRDLIKENSTAILSD